MNPRVTWLILTIVAVALRLPDIGNPVVDYDEQMYLLVGRRMWAGALPYVDIWDRKPIGLFLLYAGSQAFGGDPVVAYHLVALAAAIATAGSIALLVRRLGAPRGAVFAGIGYLVWIELIGGRGGQSPVYYNLLMIGAALCAWRAIVAGGRRPALAAMLLAGLALQIKPTTLFEGGFFGLAILAAAWRRGATPARLVGEGTVLIAVAAMPTVLAWGFYAAVGHAGAWWFANVASIFRRHVTAGDPIGSRLLGSAVVACVPLALACRGVAGQRGDGRRFLIGWSLAAIGGWMLVPPYFNHYGLPLLVPVMVASGVAIHARPVLAAPLLAVGAVLLIMSGYPHRGEKVAARGGIAATARLIQHYRGAGCLFVFNGPPALYTATGSCLPTRYPFPPHLTQASEAGATGIDADAEVAAILAGRPPVIVAAGAYGDVNRRVFARVAADLRAHYRRVGETVYVRAHPPELSPRHASPPRSGR